MTKPRIDPVTHRFLPDPWKRWRHFSHAALCFALAVMVLGSGVYATHWFTRRDTLRSVSVTVYGGYETPTLKPGECGPVVGPDHAAFTLCVGPAL